VDLVVAGVTWRTGCNTQVAVVRIGRAYQSPEVVGILTSGVGGTSVGMGVPDIDFGVAGPG
jgi:hypothetical protein